MTGWSGTAAASLRCRPPGTGGPRVRTGRIPQRHPTVMSLASLSGFSRHAGTVVVGPFQSRQTTVASSCIRGRKTAASAVLRPRTGGVPGRRWPAATRPGAARRTRGRGRRPPAPRRTQHQPVRGPQLDVLGAVSRCLEHSRRQPAVAVRRGDPCPFLVTAIAASVSRWSPAQERRCRLRATDSARDSGDELCCARRHPPERPAPAGRGHVAPTSLGAQAWLPSSDGSTPAGASVPAWAQ